MTFYEALDIIMEKKGISAAELSVLTGFGQPYFSKLKVGAWLLKNGNTRQGLAQMIGISRPALNNRLDGKTKWNWNEVLIVSQVLGCPLNELAGME